MGTYCHTSNCTGVQDVGSGIGYFCKDEGWWASAKKCGQTGKSQDCQQSPLCPNHVYASSVTFTCRKDGFDCLAGQESEMSYNMLRKQNSTSEIRTYSCQAVPEAF